MLVSAGQPIFGEDTWWHLSMGAAHTAQGPWLGADPLLHTAAGPPAPAAWLFDVGLFALERGAGFHGLRVAHALLVAAILGLAWSLLRRASGSAAFASFGTGVFVALSAYRLFQLRPDLASVLAVLLLARLLLADVSPPSARRLLGVAVLFTAWANLHGAFVLGLVLLAAAAAGQTLACLLRPHPPGWSRARRLLLALLLASVASLLNPSGVAQHLLYFTAGRETPALEIVADEWAPVVPWQLPVANLPPSPLAWLCVWVLLIATPLAVWMAWRRGRGARGRRVDTHVDPATGVGEVGAAVIDTRVDPALLAMAAISLPALLSAVRLLWLAILPLLLVGRCLRAPPGAARPRAPGWLAAGAALLVPGFVWLGDWRMISAGIHPALYTQPYALSKLDLHAVWFLRDAGLEGNLFNDYATGNFLGYWLSPALRVFVNGSLNVPLDVMEAREAIRLRRPGNGAGALELLDRHRVDVFFGTGLPTVPSPGRPEIATTTHLEHAPGWIPIFRSARSALHLRDVPRNAENLARVAAFYARAGVPFDPRAGFDVQGVIRQAPGWAVEHGLLPPGHQRLERDAHSFDPMRRPAAREQLARLYAVLGAYEGALASDGARLRAEPSAVAALRRRVYCLLHLRRAGDALEAAERLAAASAGDDAVSRHLVSEARRHAEVSGDAADALVALLPLLTRDESRLVLAGLLPGPARTGRPFEQIADRNWARW